LRPVAATGETFQRREVTVTFWGIISIIFTGFVVGMIARILSPGPNNPSGFVLTAVLGVAGAFLATLIGQMTHWYSTEQGAGWITSTIGALVVLFIWNRLAVHRVIPDPGISGDSGPPPR
jgi:uncharacterized membrane protein YeaQ/YmgE (transglycosylase-associated protein family)